MPSIRQTMTALATVLPLVLHPCGPTGSTWLTHAIEYSLISGAQAQTPSIDQRLAAIITTQLGVDVSRVTAQASLIKDLGADELDIVELVMSIEEEFGIAIPDEVVHEIKTVGDAAIAIQRLKNEHTWQQPVP